MKTIARITNPLAAWLAACLASLRQGRARDETGDVPGWVLITLMTAGLPILI